MVDCKNIIHETYISKGHKYLKYLIKVVKRDMINVIKIVFCFGYFFYLKAQCIKLNLKKNLNLLFKERILMFFFFVYIQDFLFFYFPLKL